MGWKPDHRGQWNQQEPRKEDGEQEALLENKTGNNGGNMMGTGQEALEQD